ncbi:hypothetical protein MTO96_013166 [Rhipicephalus appendiculatus]
MSQEGQHDHQLRSSIPPPPNGLMTFAQEKRRSVAADKLNENNQRVSSRLDKLWHSLSASDEQPYQRKEAGAAAVHRRRYPDYVFSQLGARSREKHERMRGSSTTRQDASSSPAVSCALSKVEVGSLEFQQPSAAITTAAEKESSCNQGLHRALYRTRRFLGQRPLPCSSHRLARLHGHATCTHFPAFREKTKVTTRSFIYWYISQMKVLISKCVSAVSYDPGRLR